MRPIKVDIKTPKLIILDIKSDLPDSIECGEPFVNGVGRPRRLPVGISDAHLVGLAIGTEAISEMGMMESSRFCGHLMGEMMREREQTGWLLCKLFRIGHSESIQDLLYTYFC